MIDVWILWLVITVTEGHLRHIPVEMSYGTRDDCELDRPMFQASLDASFPDDPNLRTYCQLFSTEEITDVPSKPTL